MHFVEDAQMFFSVMGAWAIGSLGICRVKYGQDWLDPWLLMMKVVGVLALMPVAMNERATLYAWWAAAPFLVSISVISTAAWGLAWWTRRRRTQDAIFELELRGEAKESRDFGKSRGLFYWGAAILVLLLSSLIVAAIRGLK